MVVWYTGACFDHNNVSILTTWRLWTSEHLLDLLHLNFPFSAPCDLAHMQKMATIKVAQCIGWKVQYDACSGATYSI
jgi:hypothetical protein